MQIPDQETWPEKKEKKFMVRIKFDLFLRESLGKNLCYNSYGVRGNNNKKKTKKSLNDFCTDMSCCLNDDFIYDYSYNNNTKCESRKKTDDNQ